LGVKDVLTNPDKASKAYLEIVIAQNDGTFVADTDFDQFEVEFNPTEYVVGYENQISNEYSITMPAGGKGQLYYM